MFRKELGVNYTEEQKCLDKDRYLRDYFNYEDRVDNIRCKRQELQLRAENELHFAEQQKERELLIRKAEKEEQEREMKETSEEANRVFLDKKYRQHVRENSTEIRDLEYKLKTAYVNKLRAVQIAEKQVEFARLKALNIEEAKHLQRQIEMETLEKEVQQRNTYLQKIKYKESLRHQLKEQEQKSEEEALLQFIMDKMMIDKIIQRLLEEDHRQEEEESQKRFQFQKDIQEFQHYQLQQMEWKQIQQDEENKQIIKYLAEQESKILKNQELQTEKQKRCQEMQDRLSSMLEASRKDTTEEENLRYELAAEELDERQFAKEREEFEKRLRDRLNIQRSLENQLLEKSLEEECQKEEDRRFKEKMLKKFEEEEKLQQLSNQKRRMKQLEHRRIVQGMIEEREMKRATAKQRELDELKYLQRSEEQRRKIVEEEREKILKEHAVRLLGYLPKGVVMNTNEVSMLGEEAQKFYQRK